MDYPGKVITKTQVTPTQTSASGVWTLDDASSAVKNNNWPVAGVPDPISRSLRFNSADSAYLDRTPASAGNRRTFTFSVWAKISALSARRMLFGTGDTSLDNSFEFEFYSDDKLRIANYVGGIQIDLRTTALYRDVSAWYHLVMAVDTTQATDTNRVKLYVNGTQVTSFSTATYPSQNFDTALNTTSAVGIGRAGTYNAAYYNGYMTEINFIDGQALTPSSFGSTDQQTGAWIPIKYTGTYGTNGFYLNFKDASSTSALGYDYSGNTNNWTANNFSVTAGAGNDSLTDVPTPWVAYNTTGDVGGVVRGNYATLNPLLVSTASFANGNLDGTTASTTASAVFAGTTEIPTTGKYYFEYTVNTASGDVHAVGIVQASLLSIGTMSTDSNAAYATAVLYRSNGTIYKNTSSQGSYSSISSGDIIGVAVDVAGGTCGLYKNGSLILSVTSITSTTYLPFACKNPTGGSYTTSFTFNAGQRPFAYTPPAGYVSVCTTNLPTPTIGATATTRANNYFDIVTRTGTGSTYSVSSLSFAPDLVWFKCRSFAYDNNLQDKLRGATNSLVSNLTDAEISRAGSVTSFDSNGYTGGNFVGLNESSKTYVDWMWRANGAGSSNTAGSITSTVSANTTAGFSVVTYTGTGSLATVGHGLGVKPAFILTKSRSTTEGWGGYHKSLGASYGIFLELKDAAYAAANYWNNTEPTSTVFTVNVNRTNNGTMVAYCFAEVAGYSAFGSYTGNGSTDGPFVYTGFRPKFILVKSSSNGATDWYIWDAVRNTFNVAGDTLRPNLSNAETTGNNIDILSNGFKLREVSASYNQSSYTYIYAAFAESPFKFSNAR